MDTLRKRIKTKRNYYADFIETAHTNKGVGYVFDLVTNINNHEISKTLHEVYLDALLNYKIDLISSLDLEIIKLKNNVIDDKILVRDLNTKNILVRMNEDNVDSLVIVDGLLGRPSSIHPFRIGLVSKILDRFGLASKRQAKREFKNLLIRINSYKDAFKYMQKYIDLTNHSS